MPVKMTMISSNTTNKEAVITYLKSSLNSHHCNVKKFSTSFCKRDACYSQRSHRSWSECACGGGGTMLPLSLTWASTQRNKTFQPLLPPTPKKSVPAAHSTHKRTQNTLQRYKGLAAKCQDEGEGQMATYS